MSAPAANKPLAGVRILDCSAVVMGPYGARLLADQGADVLKIEPPDGDIMRGADSGGAIYAHLNRGKRVLNLDLKSQEGRAQFHRLAAEADVLMHNMRAKAAEKLGLSRASLKDVNPNLIVASAVGYGSSGPYSDRPAYDDVIQSASGLTDIIGRVASDGEPGYVPLTLSDRVVGIHLAQAVAAALFARERGHGASEVEIPMFETFVDMVSGDHLGGCTFDPPKGELHYARLMARHRKPYRTVDGFLSVLLYNEAHWRRFFASAGCSRELEDPRMCDHRARTQNYEHAYGLVASILAGRTTGEWAQLLATLDIPFSPVNTLRSLLDDPHLEAVGFWRRTALPDGSTFVSPAQIGNWSNGAHAPQDATLTPPVHAPVSEGAGVSWNSR